MLGEQVVGKTGRQRAGRPLAVVGGVTAQLDQVTRDARGALLHVDDQHTGLHRLVAEDAWANGEDPIGALPAVEQLLAEQRPKWRAERR